jgi:hypothetical protein
MIRSIINRWRESVANRRRAPRRKAKRDARLLFSLSLLDPESAAGAEHLIPLEGYTRDISETGLSLIVPTLRISDTYLTDVSCKLRIVLVDLPTGKIEIYAKPVRYEQLDEPEKGHLIGVEITQLSVGDRARLLQYLSTLH